MYTWRKEWINKYESTWGILEKFKYANTLSNNELYQLLGVCDNKGAIRKKIMESHKSYITMNGFDEERVKSILGANLKEKSNNDILSILSLLLKNKSIEDADIENYFDKNVRICPICIKEAYHSILHQCNLFDYCFIHPEKLLKFCPACNSANIYEFYNTYNEFGFQCSKCGYLYLEYNYTFFENWNRKVINIKSDYKKWMLLNNTYKDKCIIMYSYNEKINSREEININFNRLYDIFFYISNNLINTKNSNLEVLEYKEINATKYRNSEILFMDIKKHIYKSYKSILKSISRNLVRKNRHIQKNLRNIEKNRCNLYFEKNEIKKYNISKIIGTTEIELYDCIPLYAYILWRRDIEGLDSYEDVHTKSYYGDHIYLEEAFYYRAVQSKIYKYVDEECYKYYKIHRYTNTHNFMCIIENIISYMILQHYKNWMEYFEKSIKKSILTKDTISSYMEEKISYNMPNFIVYYPDLGKTDYEKIKFCAFLNNKDYKCT